MRCVSLLSALLACASLPAPQVAADEPLYVRNLSPVTGLIGLPSQRDAATTTAGTVAVALHAGIASHYINDGNTREFVNLDGETTRAALDIRFGLAENWDVQVELPWLDHAGGNLDGAIDDWHDFWGMSDGGRNDVPRDQFDFRYTSRDGGFALTEGASGMGDLTLAVNHVFYRADGAAASAVLGYKFATGDDADFTGSGADDVYLALRFSGEHLSDLPLTWHGQAGYLRAGDSDLLDGVQENDLWFAGLSLDWRVAASWSLLAQVDGHAGPLDSGLTATGDDAWMLTVGGRWRLSPHWEIDVSLIEDIQVESAPDVTFQASVRFRGAGG